MYRQTKYVLVDYNRPVHEDCLLPAGRLRENANALKRADYIIVTKCPSNLQPIERRILSKQLKIKPYQQLFFTKLGYGAIQPLSANAAPATPSPASTILCVTGIAQPGPYLDYLKHFTPDVISLKFPDHHHFSAKDIRQIETRFQQIKKQKNIFLQRKKTPYAQHLHTDRRTETTNLLYSGDSGVYPGQKIIFKRNIRIC